MKQNISYKNFLLLQVNDALFPIGGYSHSYGLETYIQKGIVIDEKSAEKYIENNLRNNLCYTEFLIVRFAYEYAKSENLKSLIELEEIVEASKTAYELREAGRKLGTRFVKTVINLDINYESDIFKKYIDVRKGNSINHACVYGIFCAAIGISEIEALNMYLYSQTSAMITTCVKTIPLSQTKGQELLFNSYKIFNEILEKIFTLDENMLCISTPGFDISSMQHENLYSRLYMS